MPVLTDADVGLGSTYLSDEDVGLMDGYDEYAGGETQSPEELASAEEISDVAARAKLTRPERLSGVSSAVLGGATDLVDAMHRPIAQVRKGIAGIGTNLGIYTPEEFQQKAQTIDRPAPLIPSIPEPGGVYGGTAGKITAGVGNAVIDFVNGMADPDAAMQLGVAGLPSAGQKALMTAFAVTMAKEAPEQFEQAAQAAGRGETQEAARIAGGGVGSLIFQGLMAAHANAPAPRFTPPERGGIPDSRLNQGEQNAISQRISAPLSVGESPAVGAEVGARTEAQAQAEPQKGNAPQEPSPVLLDKSKWTKATDTENLKAATPEQRVAAAEKPLDVDSFLKEDAEGYRAVDPEKLMKSLEGGHITGGSPAVDALLMHLLKPSDLHPLSSIRMLNFTPHEAQLLTGTSAPFHGRFSKKSGQSSAMVEMTMKMQKGEPVSQAQFVETLAHELGHNNITSKFADATPEMRKDIDDVFAFAKERGVGTEWENHNSLTSAHELFAEIADPKVHEWLAGLDYSENIRKVDIGIAKVPAITPPNIRNSALGRILEIAKKLLKLPDFITDAFGNKVETISALDQIISLSSRLEKVQRGGGDTQFHFLEAKDFKSAIKDTEKVTNEELMANKTGATGFMWDLGAKAKTPEHVAQLRTMVEESNAKISALAKEGKIEEAMAVAGRQPAEAYEFATGVKLDGTPKWEMFEKRVPGYVPPVPDAKYLAAKGEVAKPTISEVSTKDKLIDGGQADAFSASNIGEMADKLHEAGSADSPPMGPEFKQRFEEAIAKSKEYSEMPVEKLVKGINRAFVTINKGNGTLTIHTEGHGANDAIAHETVTVAATEDGALRLIASSGKTPRLLKFSIEQAVRLFDPKLSEVKDQSQIPAQAQKWTGATEEAPLKPIGGQPTGLSGQLNAGIPNPAAVVAGIKQAVADFGPGVKAAGKVVSDAVRDIYKENLDIRKVGDLDRSVLNWSSKMQRSFGEATSAGKDIDSTLTQAAEKQMGGSVFTRLAEDMATGGRKPNQKQMVEVADDALSNWLEAGGGRKSATASDIENRLVFRRNAATDPKLKAGYEAALHLSPEEKALAVDGRTAYNQLWKRAERWGLVDKDPKKPSSFRDDYVTHIWNLGKGAFAGGARTLRDQFRFAKARTFENFFEGEQAGMKPKTKRLSQILPVYIHELNSVIAAKQLVKQLWDGKASDGISPLMATKGQATSVDGAKGEAVLVRPEARSPDSAKKGLDISKYKTLPDQPALHDWIFIGKDTAGNPVYEKSDLVLHPEAYKKLKAILGKSKIREWYETKTTATMEIPKAIAKGLDMYQSETKRTMLGLISPFHQVQEGTHAIGHRVNPFFNVPKPNMDNPAHLDAAKHGLMILPDRASERNFTEGLRPSGLVSFIPGVGKLADFYSNYLFHEYIPGLKIKTYDAVLGRNMKVYEKQLTSGEVKPEDVKLLSSTQVNAAYGHLNYADLGRDPTIQHILQLGLLAPDFLEARAKFTGQGLKGLTGAKVGREQLLALATLAVGQAALSWTMAQLTDGEWDGAHPFEFRKNNRRYTMRSVPEDLMRFAEDIHTVFTKGGGAIPFISNRVNPITGKVPMQLYSGRDWKGNKITPGGTLKEAATAWVPLTARGFMGIDNSPLEDWEQLAGAAGLKIMRYSPQNEVHKLFVDWKKKSDNPKLIAQAEQAEAQTFAPSEYSDLRQALEKDDVKAAAKAADKLFETHSIKEIKRAMNPVSIDPSTGAVRDRMLPKALEREFLGSLTDEDREVYEAAKRQRRLLYQRFQKMLSE